MNKLILIVEDNEENLLLAEKILNFYGYQTMSASLGQVALQYCDANQFDLILMDLSLPDIDGLEVTRLLRKRENFQEVPIIALTAHAMRGIQETTEEAGMDAFLAKPFLPDDLIELITKYIR